MAHTRHPCTAGGEENARRTSFAIMPTSRGRMNKPPRPGEFAQKRFLSQITGSNPMMMSNSFLRLASGLGTVSIRARRSVRLVSKQQPCQRHNHPSPKKRQGRAKYATQQHRHKHGLPGLYQLIRIGTLHPCRLGHHDAQSLLCAVPCLGWSFSLGLPVSQPPLPSRHTPIHYHAFLHLAPIVESVGTRTHCLPRRTSAK